MKRTRARKLRDWRATYREKSTRCFRMGFAWAQYEACANGWSMQVIHRYPNVK